MDEQKRFKKQELKRDDYKAMEQGAIALKCALGALGSICLIIKNKNNLKAISKSTLEIVERVIKK